MSLVLSNLYVGDEITSGTLSLLMELGVSSVVNLNAPQTADFFQDVIPALSYFDMELCPKDEDLSVSFLDAAVSFLESRRFTTALVFCKRGRNRSVAVCVAWVMYSQRMFLKHASMFVLHQVGGHGWALSDSCLTLLVEYELNLFSAGHFDSGEDAARDPELSCVDVAPLHWIVSECFSDTLERHFSSLIQESHWERLYAFCSLSSGVLVRRALFAHSLLAARRSSWDSMVDARSSASSLFQLRHSASSIDSESQSLTRCVAAAVCVALEPLQAIPAAKLLHSALRSSSGLEAACFIASSLRDKKQRKFMIDFSASCQSRVISAYEKGTVQEDMRKEKQQLGTLLAYGLKAAATAIEYCWRDAEISAQRERVTGVEVLVVSGSQKDSQVIFPAALESQLADLRQQYHSTGKRLTVAPQFGHAEVSWMGFTLVVPTLTMCLLCAFNDAPEEGLSRDSIRMLTNVTGSRLDASLQSLIRCGVLVSQGPLFSVNTQFASKKKRLVIK